MTLSLQQILQSHTTGQPVVMGILNVTPDSFSDGGLYAEPAAALRHVQQMLLDGADIIDVGAESTRPGAQRMSADEQKRRLEPILPAAVEAGALVSVDTTRTEVARWALDAGAAILNDVSAGSDDPDMLPLAAKRNVPIVLMHMRGEPADMQANPRYDDVVGQVRDFLAGRLAAAREAGIPGGHCVIDPGIGFGKRLEHNLSLLARVEALASLGVAVLVGPSRKRFIRDISGQADPNRRVGGTVAACLAGLCGGATIFRVHDVEPVRQALEVARAIRSAS
jgi:dihydropteroate synthase